MTLRASLLHDLENSALSVDKRVEVCCEVARELEHVGEWEEARNILGEYWSRIGDIPKVAGLEPTTAAELLLRAGVLTGIIGSHRQIDNAQEIAKDLLTKSYSIFHSRRITKKIAEAQTELALCYWRTDDLDEARDFLRQALSLLPIANELKAKALLRLAIVEHSASNDQKALRILEKNASLFNRINNHMLRGSFHINLGNRLENLADIDSRSDYIDRALIEYAASSYHFELAGHRPYLANVETNLGYLYYKIQRLDEATEHLDRARRIYVSIKDSRTAAQVDETRARVFLEQGRLAEAERVARSAVRVQEKSGNATLLTEALITYGRVLARWGRYGVSLGVFRRAVELSDQAGLANRAAEAALAAFREMGDHLVTLEGGQLVSGRGVSHDKLAVEHEAIKLALEQANGGISHAARLAGMSWQALSYALRTRHRDLLEKRRPVRPRKHRE